MKHEEFKRVRDKVFYSGFAHQYDIAIKENMEKGLDAFKLSGEHVIDDRKVKATLSFKKGEQDYFFNSFELEFTSKQGEVLKRSFSIDNSFNKEIRELYPDLSLSFTLKEAFNYMEGRHVYKLHKNKDGDIYPAWKALAKDEEGKLVRKQYGPEHGFKLEMVVTREGLLELRTGQGTKDLIKSFRKGNITTGTYHTPNGEYQRKLVVDAEHKCLNVVEPHLILNKKEKAALSATADPKVSNTEKIEGGHAAAIDNKGTQLGAAPSVDEKGGNTNLKGDSKAEKIDTGGSEDDPPKKTTRKTSKLTDKEDNKRQQSRKGKGRKTGVAG